MIIKIVGDYEIVKVLDNHHWITYKAVNFKTKKEVVVKSVSSQQMTNTYPGRFSHELLQEEMRIHRFMGENSHFQKPIDKIRTRKNFYYIYEYCNGGTLRQLLEKYLSKQQKVMPLPECLVVFKKIIEASGGLRSQYFDYYGLRPENILFHNDMVKFIGYSHKLLQKEPSFNANVPTPIHLAPQILHSDKNTRKSDIWCLGVVLFEMIFGVVPFNAFSIPSLIKMQQAELKIPFSIPKSLDVLMRRMLKYSPQERIEWDQLLNTNFNDIQKEI